MASRKIEDCVPELQEKYWLFKEKMDNAGIPFILTCTARTIREQMALYAQGRESLDHVNALRKIAGLGSIPHDRNVFKVTWTLKSNHIIDLDDGKPDNDKARAFDIVILGGKRQPTWDIKTDVNENEITDYEEAGKIGESVSLKWGGRFKNSKGQSRPDYPHFEV
ncbi:MAG: M15 family metallopeptidase [Desulfobacterales bacterium]|nr:M15 family metallopeptidase [Desulfobacterales bacterium]